jgi:hypothetical protein
MADASPRSVPLEPANLLYYYKPTTVRSSYFWILLSVLSGLLARQFMAFAGVLLPASAALLGVFCAFTSQRHHYIKSIFAAAVIMMVFWASWLLREIVLDHPIRLYVEDAEWPTTLTLMLAVMPAITACGITLRARRSINDGCDVCPRNSNRSDDRGVASAVYDRRLGAHRDCRHFPDYRASNNWMWDHTAWPRARST